MKDVEIIGMLKSYVSKLLVGMGALKGANCQIESIAEVTGGQKITFLWIDTNNVSHRSELTVPNGADGVGIASIEKTSTAGLVDTYTITLTDSITHTFTVTNGAKGNPGDDGFSPTIVEDPGNTEDIYRLDITDVNGTIVTPNLKGGGSGGTTNYNALDNLPQINGVTLAGNLSTSDIGINVPTKTSDLTNDSNFVNQTELGTTLADYTTALNQLLADKVDKESGKGLSANDFTNTLKDKLDGIESSAEVNKIDLISVNGVAQSISNKAVNLDVASNLITEDQWTQIQALLV